MLIKGIEMHNNTMEEYFIDGKWNPTFTQETGRDFVIEGTLYCGEECIIEGDDWRHPDAIHIGSADHGKIDPVPVKVAFSGPATIVWWSDGEKTVAKCRECRKCAMVNVNRTEKGRTEYTTISEMFKDLGNWILVGVSGGIACGSRYSRFNGVMAAILKRYVKQPAKTITKLIKEADEREAANGRAD